LLVVDPIDRTAQWFVRNEASFELAERSALLSVTNDEVAASLDW
jgi:hypothetical protein